MKILIADDNQDFCNTIAEIVASVGYETHTVYNPTDAIGYIDRNYTGISLIMLDIEFGPGVKLTGLDILEHSRRRFPHIPVVMISGKGSIETAVKATKLGAINFIEKSVVNRDRIKQVLESSLENLGSDGESQEIFNMLTANGLVGKSKALLEVGDSIIRFGRTDLNILITGETGTGKRLVAKAIHSVSRRIKNPFVTVDIPNIPRELFQSELFGHTKGSFSGATDTKSGLFQKANRGTLFLDEIGDMSHDVQSNLLIPIEERIVRKVGAIEAEPVDIRFISATDKDLLKYIEENKFREPLYHRLRECEIYLPPLRERKEDIPEIVNHYTKYHNEQYDESKLFSPSAIEFLMEQRWNGNIRELTSTLKVILQTVKGNEIETKDLHKVMKSAGATFSIEPKMATELLSSDGTLKEDVAKVDKLKVESTLELVNGNVSKAAARLGVSRETLHNKIRRYGIDVQAIRDRR
jgi:DNA-binding NtrC family response regulator